MIMVEMVFYYNKDKHKYDSYILILCTSLSILLNLCQPKFIVIIRSLRSKNPTAQALANQSRCRPVSCTDAPASSQFWESQCAVSQDIWMLKMDHKYEAAKCRLQCQIDLNSNLSSAIYEFQDFIQIF